MPAPIVITCGLGPAVIGDTYSEFLTQVGGGPATVFGISPGILNSGLILNQNTGEVAGIPITGNWTAAEITDGLRFAGLSVSAIDPADVNLFSDLTLCGMSVYINCVRIAGNCNNPPAGSIGLAYSHTVSASNGIAPYSFAITSGALPDGLVMDSAGNITGIPTTNGWFTFTITVTGTGDPLNNVVSFSCSISIGDASPNKSPQLYYFSFGLIGVLSIDCGDPPVAVVGASYTHLFPIVPGGLAPYTYAITVGALPAGLALVDPPNSSIVDGIVASAPGVFPFTIEVTDADDNPAAVECSITVVAALNITCDNPPDGAVDVPYSHFFPATGGVEPYTFSIAFGVLPGGLSLDPDTGEISGIPNTAGTFNFTVKVTDSYTGAADPNTDLVECSITITGVSGPLELECDNPPAGETGVLYNHTLPVSGGTPPYTFTLIAGSLPTGLILGVGSGIISGTPTVAGDFTFTVRVTDDDATTDDVECSISIVSATGLEIVCDDPPPGKLAVPYSHFFPASGGTEPYTFSLIDGTLPPGLSLDAATGELSGVPTLSGFYEFTILVTDDEAAQSQVTCSIRIKQCLLVEVR